MAHKTKINSTAYDITGGKALVSGTSYSIKNGKVLIGGTAYDISFILPPVVLDLWSGSGTYNEINSVIYADGYWVVGGQYYANSTYYARIAYTTDLNGTWTTKDLWEGKISNSRINCITYTNGYWVVGGGYYDSADINGARIAYSTSLTGSWTMKDLWDGRYSCVNCITYDNNYWVVGGGYYTGGSRTYGRIAYTTSLTGSWTTKDLWDPSGKHTSVGVYGIAYGNGYWMACGISYDTANMAYASYATSLSGTWKRADSNVTSGKYTKNLSVIYANGYWVMVGRSSMAARICYAISPNGTWTKKTLWKYENASASSAGDCINCVTYANGYWVVGGLYNDGSTYYARIAYTTSLTGTWTMKDLWSLTGSKTSVVNDVVCGNNYWLVGGQYYDGSVYYARLAYAGSPGELGDTK